MRPLEGIHHISAFTSDAQRNVDFYADLLGLRLIKKSINQDNTSVYHLFYGDEEAHPGSDITFFEYPGMRLGRAGAGMVHRIVWRVAATQALDFWESRLHAHGYSTERVFDEQATDREESLLFADWEGLEHELVVASVPDQPLAGVHPQIPARVALQGFHAVRAYSRKPQVSRETLEGLLGFQSVSRLMEPAGHPASASDRSSSVPPGPAASSAAPRWEARGSRRGGSIIYDPAPEARGLQGAGTVHHVAWAMADGDVAAWDAAVTQSGAHSSGLVDRHYFQSIYFREPSGVLFELASSGPGFTVDEPLQTLGTKLSLTPKFEHLRGEIEPRLTTLRNPRDRWVTARPERQGGRLYDGSCRRNGPRRCGSARGLCSRMLVASDTACMGRYARKVTEVTNARTRSILITGA